MAYYDLSDEREVFKIGQRVHDWFLGKMPYLRTLEEVQAQGFDAEVDFAYIRDGNIEVTAKMMKEAVEAVICELRALPYRELEGEPGALHEDNLGIVIASMIASGYVIPSSRRPSHQRTITGIRNILVYILRRDA